MEEFSLRSVQRMMKGRIRPGGEPAVSLPSELLNPQRGTPGAEQVAVYADGYRARIREALEEAYPAVRHILGAQTFFEEVAAAYAARYPSRDYNLSFAGRHLPECLVTAPVTRQLPFLPDLARLEWAVCQAFHAFLQPPRDLQRLTGLEPSAWDRVQFLFQPSVAVVASAWPILDLWEARHQPREAINIDLVNRPQQVLVCRQGLTVRCEAVERLQAVLLERLLAGEPLGAACEAMLRGASSAEPPPVAAWCARWVRDGLIVELTERRGY